MSRMSEFVETYLARIPRNIRWVDIVEILIISFLVYHILAWIKNTRAWSLLKGIIVIAAFILIAAFFEMKTILWIVENAFSVAIMAVVVILQPELRKALEDLGRKNLISSLIPFDTSKVSVAGRFSDKTINEIAKACVEMGKVKTGALIVVEQNQSLAEYERTGIDVDGIVTSQLLINIFEHNTPLHDGAVIIRGDRIVAATCYLPLSDNRELSKQLGTRHRAGVGISEVSDSLTIIVSEETGHVSMVQGGVLHRGVTFSELKKAMRAVQNKTYMNNGKFRIWKRGRDRNEKDSDE